MSKLGSFTEFDPPIFWIGEIEDRLDPLCLGRCRVRIFGFHTPDKNVLPTSDLPWSHAIMPLNNSKRFSSPNVGDWVLGLFMDGPASQFPIMLGVLPGLKK